MTEEERAKAVTEPLLEWFDQHKRDLPWRKTDDPYRIWVSEIMLQQTQVDRVRAYYERFLEAFPTFEDLADAVDIEVLPLWEGLGYYSRVRNMLAAAREVVEHHGGEFPRTMEEALALPGVGEYTAGAVLSIAWDIPVPAVDANVVRVIARVFAIEGKVSRGKARRRISELARTAIPDTRAGDFNQALMELGAQMCQPWRPGCLICPLCEICRAREMGLQAQIPQTQSRPVKQMRAVAGVLRHDGKLLVARRPPDGQWGGLWEFPHTKLDTAQDRGEALCEQFARQFEVEVAVGEEITSLTYGVMNRRVNLTVLACEMVAGDAHAIEHDDLRWVAPEDLEGLPMPSPHRSIADVICE